MANDCDWPDVPFVEKIDKCNLHSCADGLAVGGAVDVGFFLGPMQLVYDISVSNALETGLFSEDDLPSKDHVQPNVRRNLSAALMRR